LGWVSEKSEKNWSLFEEVYCIWRLEKYHHLTLNSFTHRKYIKQQLNCPSAETCARAKRSSPEGCDSCQKRDW
jgi:hypothetical protein